MADTFQLMVRIEINKLTDQHGYTGERMTINEEFRIGVNGWVQIAEILGKFHALAGEIGTEAP